MPTRCGLHDSKGYYCRWGNHGKKYYYDPDNPVSRERARNKADAQGRAAHAHGFVGSSKKSEISEKRLPNVKPNEDEEAYVSHCIEYETKHSPDRPREQIARMCYEKYRNSKKSISQLQDEILNLTEDINLLIESISNSNLNPRYYSKSKPFYRFEMNTIEEELKSCGWDKKKLLVDIKCDGLRLSLGKIDGQPFIYVDPTLLKRKSSNVTERLPSIVKDLRSLPDNTVIDGEFIAVKDNEILHRTTANALLNATNFSPESLAEFARVFAFDCLFYKGEDIREQPLHERLEYLQRIKSTPHIWIERTSSSIDSKADAYLIDGSDFTKLKKIMSKIFANEIDRPKYIAEGVMIKDMAAPYESPINHGWGKLKKFYEVDTVVWDKKVVKGSADIYNYMLGISVSKEQYDKLPNKYKVPNMNLQDYGKSDNTKIECGIGKVLRVASEEVLKDIENGVPIYRGYINVALEPVPEKSKSDSLEVLDKLSSFQPKRIPIAEISRINKSDNPITQEEVITHLPIPSGSRGPPEGTEQPNGDNEPNGTDIAQSITKFKYDNKQILQWVEEKNIPKDIYKSLAKENEPLPKQFYIDQKEGKAWAQMHFRGILPEEYNDFKSKKKSLPDILVGHSAHIDLRIKYPGEKKLVQYVITENDIQSMVRMLRGESRETAGGVMNVQHSMVVSKPSGEPPEEQMFWKKAETDDDKNLASINKEGAELAESIIIKEGSYWIEPGEVGATKNTYSYMSLIWEGIITSGVERHDVHELFMKKTRGSRNIFEGKFTIKCLKRPDSSARWEIWKSSSEPIPMDPIQHSDCGYHYLAPPEKVDKFGREAYRDLSQKLYKRKLS